MNLKIEYVDKEQLKPYKNNAKIHTDSQIEQIKNSIREFGFNDPIAVWHDNEIIEGHGRLIAAMQMEEIETVPVIRLDELTDEQRRAYMLVHNKLTMNTDFDLDLLNIEIEDISEIDMGKYSFDMQDLSFPEKVSVERRALADRFLVPPFSVINSDTGSWMERKRTWLDMGIRSELGRGGDLCFSFPSGWRDNHR